MACLARVGAGMVLGAGLQQLYVAKNFQAESPYRGKAGDVFTHARSGEQATLEGYEGIGGSHQMHPDKKSAQKDSLAHGFTWIRISTTKGCIDENITVANLEGQAGANLRFGSAIVKTLRTLSLLKP